MNFKSELAQNAWIHFHTMISDGRFDRETRIKLTARAIEVAAKIEIEEMRLAQAPLAVPDHWKNPYDR